MRAMKDSGIPWVGEMPECWELRRMKMCIRSRISGAWGEEAKGDDGDIICLRIADFDYDRFSFRNSPIENLTVRNYDKDTIQRLLLRKGDLLIEKSGGGEKTPVGRTVVFDKDYPALYANFMDCLRCVEAITSKWMQYVFVTFYKNDYTRNYIKQTTGIQNLDLTSMLSCERIPIPSYDEQNRITAFLDTECAWIDAVMKQTRASIEEYKKLKQSIITEAVTKGIRPNRPMRNSGIKWIGQIPADWKVERIKFFLKYIESGVSVNAASYPAKGNEVGVLKSSCVSKFTFSPHENKAVNQEELSRVDCGVKKNTIIMSRMNTPELVGACGYVDKDYPNLFLPDRLWQVHFTEETNVKYVWYYLNGKTVRSYYGSLAVGTSNSMQNISQDQFYNTYIIVPGKEEQDEIVAYLDQKSKRIEGLIEQKNQLLFEMDSYKRSLIFEYVTGKKEA